MDGRPVRYSFDFAQFRVSNAVMQIVNVGPLIELIDAVRHVQDEWDNHTAHD